MDPTSLGPREQFASVAILAQHHGRLCCRKVARLVCKLNKRCTLRLTKMLAGVTTKDLIAKNIREPLKNTKIPREVKVTLLLAYRLPLADTLQILQEI